MANRKRGTGSGKRKKVKEEEAEEPVAEEPEEREEREEEEVVGEEEVDTKAGDDEEEGTQTAAAKGKAEGAADEDKEDEEFPTRRTAVSMQDDDEDFESEDEDTGTMRHRAREAHQSMETGQDDELIDTADEPSSPETSPRADRGEGSSRKKRSNSGLLPNPSAEKLAPRDSNEIVEESISVTESQANFLLNVPFGRTGRFNNRDCVEQAANVRTRYMSRTELSIWGRAQDVERAKFYFDLFFSQRSGQVYLDKKTLQSRSDVTVVPIPIEAAGIVSGKGGSNLRMLEQRHGVLLFYLRETDFGSGREVNRKDVSAAMLIFGSAASRCGAELKVLSLIDFKVPGYVKDSFLADMKQRYQEGEDGFAIEMIKLGSNNMSYVLGRGGSTKTMLLSASGCVVEYLGDTAIIAGVPLQRERARTFLDWLLKMRDAPTPVDVTGRADVTVVEVPDSRRAPNLRDVQRTTGTFCFSDGQLVRPGVARVIVCGVDAEKRFEARRLIREMVGDAGPPPPGAPPAAAARAPPPPPPGPPGPRHAAPPPPPPPSRHDYYEPAPRRRGRSRTPPRSHRRRERSPLDRPLLRRTPPPPPPPSWGPPPRRHYEYDDPYARRAPPPPSSSGAAPPPSHHHHHHHPHAGMPPPPRESERHRGRRSDYGGRRDDPYRHSRRERR